MAYTINRGYQNNHNFNGLQRALLAGLPAIALILSFGAIWHHGNNGHPASDTAKLIPIVSSLSGGENSGGKSSGGQGSQSNTASPGANGTTGGNSAAASTAPAGGGTVASGSGSGGSTLIGGRGGGPTGGTTGGGSGGTGTSGGTATLPDCSLNQLATVTCQVPECSPAVTLKPGQKAILGIGGTCVVIN